MFARQFCSLFICLRWLVRGGTFLRERELRLLRAILNLGSHPRAVEYFQIEIATTVVAVNIKDVYRAGRVRLGSWLIWQRGELRWLRARRR